MPTGWPRTLLSRASRALLGVAMGLTAGGALALLGPVDVAMASVSIPVSFDDLVERSVGIAVVTPVSETSVWEGGRIFTYTEMRIDALIAGRLRAASEPVWVQTLGGVVDRVGQSVEGEASFTVGHPSLVFLMSGAGTAPGTFIVAAHGQGQFPIVLDAEQTPRVRRSAVVGGLLAPKAGLVPGPLAANVLHGRSITEATALVTAAWGRLHAP
jgi:hypothetical protein